MNEQITHYVLNELTNDDSSLATLVHMMYPTQYCAIKENETTKWYKQTDKGWYSSSSVNYEIKLKMSTELIQLLMTTRGTILRQRIQTNDTMDTRVELIRAIEKNLYNTPYKDRLLKECEALFMVEELPSY